MTVKDKQVLEDMQKKIERLSLELKEFESRTQQADGFENLETDHFLTEVYN